MSPDDRDQPDDVQPEHSYEETARSIFSALWFRVVLVLIVCGVIAAVAVPYVLEWMNPPPKTAAVRPAPPAPKPLAPPATPPATAPAPPAAPTPAVTPAPAPAPAIAKEEKEKEAAKPARRPARTATAKAPAKAVAKAPAGTGAYFVQVGAFKDPERAKSLAVKLRELKFTVDESTAGPAGEAGGSPGAVAPGPATAGDKYDVFVSGASAADLSARLTAKGLATERSGGGVVVKPSLPLRDAVALSKDLAAEGLKVQVRRAGSPAPAPAAAPPAVAASGETLHRVRVGPFADLAAARAARAELEAKGYKGFIARGGG